MQMAICLACGLLFIRFSTPKPIKVLCVFAEDDGIEIHRRLNAILSGLWETDMKPDISLLEKNLLLVPAVGLNIRLVIDSGHGALAPTINTVKLIETIKQHGIELALLDPLRTLTDGEENNNSAQNRFIETIETVRRETGAGIGLVHHAAKADGQNSRGASALRDGVRHVFALARNDAGDLILSSTKENYVGKLNGITLEAVPANHGIYFVHNNDSDMPRAAKADKQLSVHRAAWEKAWWDSGAQEAGDVPYLSRDDLKAYLSGLLVKGKRLSASTIDLYMKPSADGRLICELLKADIILPADGGWLMASPHHAAALMLAKSGDRNKA